MTLQELLNSEMDLQSLAAFARQGFAWWIDELLSMAPPAWRARLSRRPRVSAMRLADGRWRFWRDGHRFEGDAQGGIGREAVGILLPREAVLTREIKAPRMTAADARRMSALDIDRLSPLKPELIHFDMEVVGRDPVDGGLTLLLGVTPRVLAAQMVEEAQSRGLNPASLGIAPEEEGGEVRFDFLPAVLEAGGVDRRPSLGVYLWGAVAALFVLNLAVLVGRDMADVSNLRRKVEDQAPAVSAALRVRGRVEAENSHRRQLADQGVRGDPLRVLNALTQAVPQGAWIQHLEWNGQVLRIVGFKSGDIDMLAAIRGSGAFSNPRAVGVEAPAKGQGGQPFDITADARAVP